MNQEKKYKSFKCSLVRFMSYLYKYSALVVCTLITLLLLIKYEADRVESKFEILLSEAISRSEINRLLIIESIERDSDLIDDFYSLSSSKDFNVAFDNGKNVSYSESVTSEFDSHSRSWYQCAKKKMINEYCISEPYINAFPPYHNVITFSYPILKDSKLIAVGLTDFKNKDLDSDTYTISFLRYDLKDNKVIFNYLYDKITFLFLIIINTYCFLFFSFNLINRKIINLIKTDKMSGLKRRDAFDEKKVDSRVIAFAMIDIDNFKKINDQYGHYIGDEAITLLSKCIQENLRKKDVAFRWGGEEFLIVLRGPESQKQNLSYILNKLRQRIENLEVPGVPNFTVSIGFSEYDTSQSVHNCIEKADDNLYKAKANGRNCVRGA